MTRAEPLVRRRLILWILSAAALAALLAVGLGTQRAASVGRLAPALPRERLAGPSLKASDLPAAAGGRATLITFWASWCGPCAREAPALELFSGSQAGDGRLIAVDWSDGLSEARSFIRHYGWTFSNLRDAEGTVGNDYHLTVLPTTFVIDAHGRIRAVLRGPQSVASLRAGLQRAAPS